MLVILVDHLLVLVLLMVHLLLVDKLLLLQLRLDLFTPRPGVLDLKVVLLELVLQYDHLSLSLGPASLLLKLCLLLD